MTVKFEYYNTGDDSYDAIGYPPTTWDAQTFTPLIAHKIKSVKLKLYKHTMGSPNTITVSIRATDDDGKPTGDDLCSGTIDGNSLTTALAGEWAETTLGVGYDLVADTKYAIVVRAPDATESGHISWRTDSSSPSYTRGNNEWSDDSGVTWTTYTDYDMMFEEWGTYSSVYHIDTKTKPKYIMTTSVKGGG